MRQLLTLILCLLLSALVSAQDSPSPYEIALQRIEEARETNATHLALVQLGLTELPPEIGSLPNLINLYLGNNLLTSLPAEIGNLNNLEFINLENNLLTSLPSEIGNLSKLQVLLLPKNSLSSLPVEIGKLSNLIGLDLSQNQLNAFPSEFWNLHSLQMLNLRDNQLSELPSEIVALENLCFLNLSDNHLGHLPMELSQLDKLSNEPPCVDAYTGLFLDGNPLISPPPEVIELGTPAILDYLRNQAWWHLQRLILGGTGSIGIVVTTILGLRWHNTRGKRKKKNLEAITKN